MTAHDRARADLHAAIGANIIRAHICEDCHYTVEHDPHRTTCRRCTSKRIGIYEVAETTGIWQLSRELDRQARNGRKAVDACLARQRAAERDADEARRDRLVLAEVLCGSYGGDGVDGVRARWTRYGDAVSAAVIRSDADVWGDLWPDLDPEPELGDDGADIEADRIAFGVARRRREELLELANLELPAISRAASQLPLEQLTGADLERLQRAIEFARVWVARELAREGRHED